MNTKAECAFEKLKLTHQWKNIATKYDALYQQLLDSYKQLEKKLYGEKL